MERKKPKKLYKLNWIKFLKKKERVKVPYREVGRPKRGTQLKPAASKA